MTEEPRVQLEKIVLELHQRSIAADFKADEFCKYNISYDAVLYAIIEGIKRRQEADTTIEMYEFAKELYDKTIE